MEEVLSKNKLGNETEELNDIRELRDPNKEHRIVVVGETGVGKSSLIENLIRQILLKNDPVGREAEKNLEYIEESFKNLKSANSAQGCTTKSSKYKFDNFEFIDSCGLGSPEKGSISTQAAFIDLIESISKYADGLTLLIMVFRIRITQNFINNYELFHNIISRGKIPMICVVTGCEESQNPQDWPKEGNNLSMFQKNHLYFSEIIGTTFVSFKDKSRDLGFIELRKNSTLAVLDAIYKHSLKKKVPIFTESSKLDFIRKLWNFVCKKVPYMKHLQVPNNQIKSILEKAGMDKQTIITLTNVMDERPNPISIIENMV
jgi:GTP-binding protein EngB required for normal cell division